MKTWVAVGAVLLAATPAFAQQQQEDPVERTVQRMKDQLNLTEEQTSKVRDIVIDVTEPDLPGLSWETKKARYLRRLQAAPRPSLLVAGADKTANLISMIAVHASMGEALWERFNVPPGFKLGFYRQVHTLIRSSWSTCPVLQEFGNRLEEAERKLGARP